MLGKIRIFILRQNKSVKALKISSTKTDFKYKKGKYYLQDRGCFLKGRQIYALYFEGIPNPIAFDNIIAKELINPTSKNSKKKEVNPDEKPDLNIDSTVIKDMTEKDFLNALTQTSMDKTQVLYLVVAFLSIILTVGNLYLVYQLYRLAGL